MALLSPAQAVLLLAAPREGTLFQHFTPLARERATCSRHIVRAEYQSQKATPKVDLLVCFHTEPPRLRSLSSEPLLGL